MALLVPILPKEVFFTLIDAIAFSPSTGLAGGCLANLNGTLPYEVSRSDSPFCFSVIINSGGVPAQFFLLPCTKERELHVIIPKHIAGENTCKHH